MNSVSQIDARVALGESLFYRGSIFYIHVRHLQQMSQDLQYLFLREAVVPPHDPFEF
jgi:hypothetical protein